MQKWKKIEELINYCVDDDALYTLFNPNLKLVSRAPQIGARAWIYKYKGIYIALWDMGNGHYSFYSCATLIDAIVARITLRLQKIFKEN